MRQKTLQEEYNLIKEGKGSKEIFLKKAKSSHPHLIRNASTFNEAEMILKQRSVISENVWGVATEKTEQPDWFKIFNENINESKGNTEIAALEKEASKYSENDIRYKELQKKIYDLKFEKDYALPGSKAAEKFSESLNEAKSLEDIIKSTKIEGSIADLEKAVMAKAKEEGLNVTDKEVEDAVEKHADMATGLFEAKAVEKKVSKEVTDLEEKNFFFSFSHYCFF